MKNKHHSLDSLGYKHPKDFSKINKQKLLDIIGSQSPKEERKIRWIPWVAISGIAASLVFVLTLENNFFTSQAQRAVVEDSQVTSLLIETLLLEEEGLDMRLQEALLDDFENAFVTNENF